MQRGGSGGQVAKEVAAPLDLVRLPRSAARRGAVSYCKVLRQVKQDRTWGGFTFEGELLRPGAIIEASRVGSGLLLECAGPEPGGRGHRRARTVYILWRWEREDWRELARTASANRDWTLDLGPIARRELEPARPVLVDPQASAARVMAAFERELEPLREEAQALVVRAVYDQFAARVAGGC